MQIKLGYDSLDRIKRRTTPVYWNNELTINPHVLMLGMTGVGKTHKIIDFATQMSEQTTNGLRVHVFDVHDDIEIEGCSSVRYSEISEHGINPLALNPDPHSGGVRKRTASFLNTLEKTTARLGAKQNGILRSLMMDLYASKGFQANNAETWGLTNSSSRLSNEHIYLDVPFSEKELAKQLGARWDASFKSWTIPASSYSGEITRWAAKDMTNLRVTSDGTHIREYPTLDDLVKFVKYKLEESFLGVGKDAMKALQEFHKASRAYNSKAFKAQGSISDEEEATLQKLGEKVKESVANYLSEYGTEKTVRDALIYSSADVLNSIFQRLGVLNSTGVFKSTPPPFDDKKTVHRHRIKSLGTAEQKLFVLFSLEQLFENAVQRGMTSELRDVIILDEAHKFFDDDDDNILNIIAREARKFGVALFCASQSPDHFSIDFLTSVSTKIILGIDESYWRSAAQKLRIDTESMKMIQPRHQMLVQIKQHGSSQNDWRAVSLVEPNSSAEKNILETIGDKQSPAGIRTELIDGKEVIFG